MESLSNGNNIVKNDKEVDISVQKLTLTDLPEECLRLVLSHLPLIDKFRLERVSKLWQNIIYDIQLSLRFTKLSASSQSVNYCGDYEHRVTNDDWIPQLMTFSSRTRQSPINISILEKVLLKCGHSIKHINLDLALINEEVFEVISNYCPQLYCISLSSSTGINDYCLQILANRYGRQLTHVNLQCAANRQFYFTTDGLRQFLTLCPNISVLFLASIRSQKSYRLNVDHLNLLKSIGFLCAHIPDVMVEDVSKLSQINSFSKLTKLIIDGIIYSESTIHELTLFLSELTQLKSLSFNTNCETPIDTHLITLAKSIQCLEELHLKVNIITISTIEALNYFSHLKVLDFGIWKPFETGLLTLSLSALQFCPQLLDLRLTNLLLTDVILENLHIFCPNLEKISLINMFDLSDDTMRSLSKCQKLRVIKIKGIPNIASDVTENGVISLLETMQSLILLEIPIIFDITEDLISCFKSYAKKYKNNYLTFVCGDKGCVADTKDIKSDNKFVIVSKL